MGVSLEMSLLFTAIDYYDDGEGFRNKIDPTPLGFLRQLKGLSIFDIKGKDPKRTRVITTLIHGNEPSGFIACHLWLLSLEIPVTNIRIIICNPEAAKTKPIFSNRYLAHSEDLNRFFSQPKVNSLLKSNSSTQPNSSEVACRAKNIKQAINEVKPEAIVDLHNTSGISPAFGVTVCKNDKVLDLVSLFTNQLILTGLHVGSVMEQDFNAPIVTIECGGANETNAHKIAIDGLHKYFNQQEIFDHHAGQVKVHKHPVRIELIDDASVGFSHHCLPTTDITLRADIEELNQQLTPKGEFIGWCNSKQKLPLQAIDDQGVDEINDLIEIKDGCLFAKQTMQLFMVTTVLEIATNDCLFYATVD